MMKFFLIFGFFSLTLGNRYSRESPTIYWDERIIGGEETTIEHIPYQVSLRYITSHICGGTIIDENTIITAAHCVNRKNPISFTILSGTTYIRDKNRPGKLSFVSKVIVHENYNNITQDNDVAILKLFQPLQFSEKIQPIPLQEQDVPVPPHTQAIVSGWGTTKEGKPNPTGPFALRQTAVSVMHQLECVKRYTNKLTPSMMCAETEGHDSCQGDSGGPLVAHNKLIGVVSWGLGCARPEYPGVYTQISSVRNWIEANRY